MRPEARIVKSAVKVRQVAPLFDEEEREQMRQAVLRAKIRGCQEIINNAAGFITGLCDQAIGISRAIGNNCEAEVIVDKMLVGAESVALIVDGLQTVDGKAEEACDAFIAAQDRVIAHRDAAHEALEELKSLQKRLWAKNRARSAIASLIALGVEADVAMTLPRIDWTISTDAVRAARVIAAEKDSKNLSYDCIVDAIEAVFRAKKYELQKILSERKYYYEGGLPDVGRIIAEIERQSGISFAAINDVPGTGLTYNLRRMKMLAIVNWLFYQSEYLWRFESGSDLVKVSCAKAKAEA